MKMRALILAMLLMLFCMGCARADQTVTLTFTGDCTLGSEEYLRSRETSFDSFAYAQGYDYFFKHFKELFEEDDATVINLECVFSDHRGDENKTKTYRFRGPTDFVNIITAYSIEAAVLANNHINDYSRTGLEDTKATLEAAGVAWARLKQIYYVEKGNVRIAVISVDQTTLNTNYQWLNKEITRLKTSGEANAVVMVYHGGTEYDPKHNASQAKFARNWIKLGADLVIMHHPHVVQGIEISRNRTICYSLGNFVFGGNSEIRSEPWRGDRMATSLYACVARAELHFDDSGVYTGQQVFLYPVFISSDAPHNNYQPYPVSGEDAAAVLEAIQFDTPFALPAFNEETGRVTMDFLPAEEENPPTATPRPTQRRTTTRKPSATPAPQKTEPAPEPVPDPKPTAAETGSPAAPQEPEPGE
ncbi:MAG: CapA family protein [Clostridia bacterium]|nr:CapA family protein [Clostridia bacterium]